MAVDFDPTVDHYRALGVSKDASADEIKKAYRKLAKATHPDSTGGNKAKESRFKEISVAYEVLGDAKKRAQYDAVRAGGMGSMGGGMGGAGFPPGFGGFGGAGARGTSQVFDLNDLFGQFFGGARPGAGPRVRVDHGDEPRRPPSGVAAEDAEFEAVIKASDGSPLRAEGQDVFSDARISFDRAILGTVATIPTLEGKAEVKIPPGSSSGKRLRLRGKGLPDARSGRAGDHYITVQIDVPTDLDEDAKKQLISLVTRLRKRGHVE
jgi:DnaJ-class molecular chaperone